jgi:serine phosphatase RsbU (regulator of sigma subunit)
MAVDVDRHPVELLTAAAARAAEAAGLDEAAEELARAGQRAIGADLVVVRAIGDDGLLGALAVAPGDVAEAAELAGTRSPASAEVSAAFARAATRAGAADVVAAPAEADGEIVGLVELYRGRAPFTRTDRALVAFVASQLALLVRLHAPGPLERRALLLTATGDALAAAGDARRTATQALRAAIDATHARGGAVWRLSETPPRLVVAEGPVEAWLMAAAQVVAESVDARGSLQVVTDPRLPDEAPCSVTLLLGEPPFGALQLFHRADAQPGDAELRALAGLAARTAHAVRAGERSARLESELERTRAVLDVVGEAISTLSLAHTLETGVERIAELLGVDEVGLYLLDGSDPVTAAERNLPEGHEGVARRLHAAIEGPLRARSAVQVSVAGSDRALAAVRAAVRKVGRTDVVAVPLRVGGESIGLLVAYTGDRRLPTSDLTLLASLGVQLAVAAQNARLHERAMDLGEALGTALRSERKASRQVAALYDISRSFTQTLSLDATLQAVAEALVRELEVDAAVIRVPDERGDVFVPRAFYVADPQLADAVRPIICQPQRRPRRRSQARLLDAVDRPLLRPFLERGATAALVPISSPAEVLAEVTLVSLDPASPIGSEILETAQTIARQVALAIDNARLYQQQKEFAEAMQRSLLASDQPAPDGIEIGCVYESAAQVDVGGDVYDFLELDDGRLAVVLGDVTGHGIAATADMAMAKFVFRSLAREHPSPPDFLAHANEVVVGEIALGKFITMTYVTVDRAGQVVAASAGHPPPRLLRPDGTVTVLECGGLALGIDAPQTYDDVTTELRDGDAVVLYTDGVVESRSGTELYGVERLDAVLAANAGRTAQEIAAAVVAGARSFAGNALPDDCAVVVIRRL